MIKTHIIVNNTEFFTSVCLNDLSQKDSGIYYCDQISFTIHSPRYPFVLHVASKFLFVFSTTIL